MVIDSGVTVMSCQFRKWVGKIAHLVLKMGRENYMFGLTVSTLTAALWLNFVWEKRNKILWDQGTTWPRENYVFWSENE